VNVLLQEAATKILEPGGALANALPGFESRAGQLAMTARVAQAIDFDERLLIEAGTGTGKTLAYLVPAILSGRKVVVSTGTRTLQDQIANQDLPRLSKVLEQPFLYTVMKGIGNYLCRRRLAEYERQLAFTGTDGPSTLRVLDWTRRTQIGDRAEVGMVAEDAPIWREILSSPDTRLGKRCPFVDDCFITSLRRRAQEAQILVVNHHLFFADLALRTRFPEAQVLPPYDLVIFDEAHQLEDVATEIFGVQVSTLRLFALARDVGRAPVESMENTRIESLARRIDGETQALLHAVRACLPKRTRTMEELRLPMPEDLWQGSVLAHYHTLDTVLEETTAFLSRRAADTGLEIDRPSLPSPGQAAVLASLSNRAGMIRADLAEIIGRARHDSVRWVVNTARNLILRASPINVAPVLQTAFESMPGAIIFTSATLTTGGSFSYLRDRLGLADTAAEEVVASPFRYEKQALLYVAEDLPDPTHEAFSVAVGERMHQLCKYSSGRALLLFTSFRSLRVVEEIFREKNTFLLLVQGQEPRHVLLEKLRTQVGSVLLATQSFWEGVDVPGEALSLVAIDRLPFAVPDDPLTGARIDRIREDGGDPFHTYQVPRAALALKQGFGRLIRSRRDRGVVALLDGRVSRRHYGQQLLASLPGNCPRTHDLLDVQQFFAPT
jgi:ATP-dependent DNA helicase DinG